jgi:hypothetical protein
MIHERRNGNKTEFLALLERLAQGDTGELTSLEQVLKASHEDPDLFEEEWLRPLLRQGVGVGEAFELILEGTLRPN